MLNLQRKLGPTWLLVPIILLGSLLLSACAEGIPQRSSELPPGFEEFPLPAVNVDVGAYIYIRQSQPFVIPSSLFTDAAALGQSAVVPAPPDQLEIDLLAALTGVQVTDSFGAFFSFTQESHAQWAALALEQQALQERPWFLRDAMRLTVGRGEDAFMAAFQEAVVSEEQVSLQSAYPDAWRILHMLPEDAPGEAVAAGFLQVSEQMVSNLAQSGSVDLDDLGPAINVIRIDTVAFAVYSDGPVQLPEQISADFFREADLGAVFIARSGYPSFILSFFFGNFADRIGLEEVAIGSGQTALHAQLAELHLIVKNLGSTIIFTIAPEQARAEELMVSALP